MQSLATIPGVKITAVCDIWDFHLDEGRKLAQPEAFATKDYRALLDRKDIDAVLIGTPDHWHVPITVDACAAGKDVYVEKPLTHDLSEGQRVIDAQNKHSRIVQVGTQQRCMPHFQKAYEIVKSGQLGEIHKVHLTWNRNAPRSARPNLNIDPKTVDWKRFLGTREGPAVRRVSLSAVALVLGFWRRHFHRPDGPLDRRGPLVSRPRPSADRRQHRRSLSGEGPVGNARHGADADALSGQTGVQVYFEGTFVNARNGAMCEFMGSEATLYLDRGRYEVHPERRSKLKPSELILGDGPRGADFYDKPDGELLHLANWIECIRTRKKPACPAEAGVSSASARIWRIARSAHGEMAKWS